MEPKVISKYYLNFPAIFFLNWILIFLAIFLYWFFFRNFFLNWNWIFSFHIKKKIFLIEFNFCAKNWAKLNLIFTPFFFKIKFEFSRQKRRFFSLTELQRSETFWIQDVNWVCTFFQVSWIRKGRDVVVLTHGTAVFTSDQRVTVCPFLIT